MEFWNCSILDSNSTVDEKILFNVYNQRSYIDTIKVN